MKVFRLLFLLHLSLFSQGVRAFDNEPSLKMIGSETPGVFELKTDGPYKQLYFDVTRGAPSVPVLTMAPPMRSNRLFFDKAADCTFMGTDEPGYFQSFGFSRSSFLLSIRFNTIRLKVYTLADKRLIESWEQLRQVQLAGDLGLEQSSTIQRVFPFADQVHYTPTIDRAFELLELGRVGAVIAYNIDANVYFQRSGKAAFRTSSTFELFQTGEVFTCWPSGKAKRFIAYVDRQISALRKTGSLKSLYGFEQ